MKCEKCGAEITLEDRYCPYCGAPNKAAMQHIRDMDRFEDEFEQTQQEVQTKVSSYSSIISRVVILAVLIAAAVICSRVDRYASFISNDMMQKKAEKNADAVTQQIDQYMEDGDLQRLASYGDMYGIDMSDLSAFTSYGPAIRASQQYSYIMTYSEQIVFPSGYNNEVSGYVSNIAQELEYFYQYTDPDYSERDDDTITAKLKDIAEPQIKAVFGTYFGMTDDELENLDSMTQGQILVLLEKGAQQYAEETEESEI